MVRRAYWCRWISRARARLSRAIRRGSVPTWLRRSTICWLIRGCAIGWPKPGASESSASSPGRRLHARRPTCIGGYLRGYSRADRLQHGGLYRLDCLIAVNPLQNALPRVALNNGQGVSQVDLHTIGYDFASVVSALI